MDLLPLIVESQQSLVRYSRYEIATSDKTSRAKSSLLVRDQEKPKLARLENRLPGANCDPIFATLFAVGGIYQGLKHQSPIEQKNTARVTPQRLSSYEKYMNKWHENRAAKEILGDELHKEFNSFRSSQMHQDSFCDISPTSLQR
ncbi:MAG: hypothetical protein EBR02_02720 [Alphaproteobacteria bacterium]|nr:hypothetical protein [Alphaproteobacteria bacterium]